MPGFPSETAHMGVYRPSPVRIVHELLSLVQWHSMASYLTAKPNSAIKDMSNIETKTYFSSILHALALLPKVKEIGTGIIQDIAFC